MNALELLLDKRWILKSENKDLYYQLRDGIGDIRKFATEKLGCQIVENSLLVKLEKIPAIPESFMGITEFTSQEEYAFFCILLMYLEDKEAEEQFILSQLTEYMEANMPEGTIDWTVYTSRRRLIRVLRYAVNQGILLITEGNDDVFREERQGEVLYENTGASRYFMRNFTRDIMDYQKPEDFYESDWFDMDEDRGMIRRHRVYKRILFLPGMYRANGSDEDFEYLKYYGRRLIEELEQQFDGQVHIHKGSAYFLAGESCRMGVMFPGVSGLSNIFLLCCGKIRGKIEDKSWKVNQDETVEVDTLELERLLRMIKSQYASGFGKEYREMPEGKFIELILTEMQRWTFIKRGEYQTIIYPIVGKMIGSYPTDFVINANIE